jgi:glycosyltransferase involved in cell wall biosynthesis
MRISLVSETYAPEVNGVAMTLSRLTAGLERRGHRVTVIRPRMPADYPEGCEAEGGSYTLNRPGWQIPNYPLMRLGNPSKAVLRAFWRANPPDVVHVATEGPMGISALLAASSLGLPRTSSFHTNFDDYTAAYGASWLAGPVATFLRRVHNLAACTMVPTQKQARDLNKRGYRGVCILSRGVDGELFNPDRRSEELRASWGAGPDNLVLTVVGRLAAEKKLELAVRAFQAVRAQRPDSLLLLVGGGPERDVFAGVEGVIYTGNRCSCDLASHYASADLFLFPSTTETYGNVLPEAMACGLASVAFDYAAAEEIVDDDINGLRVPFDDHDAFVGATVALATDDERRRRIAAAARNIVDKRNWKRVIDSFERHLEAARSSR